MGITGFGLPMKDVNAPVIVTTSGVQKVHADADVQQPVAVTDTVISGDIDPDATQKAGVHENTAAKIINKTGGYYVEDTLDREEGITNVSDVIVSGDVASGASQTGTQSIGVDTHVKQAGLLEAGLTTQTMSSVTEHVVSGPVSDDVTDDGALQSPGLPVEVTSGKLGPGASYSSPSWSTTIVNDGPVVGSTISDADLGTGQVGDLIVGGFHVNRAIANDLNDMRVTNFTGDVTLAHSEVVFNSGYRGAMYFVARLTGSGSWSFITQWQDEDDLTWSTSNDGIEGSRIRHTKY